MTEAQKRMLPKHLNKYIVEQDYSRYSPEDQAVWRYIMRQLKDYLSQHAHPCYVEGLEKTGISVEYIPKIEEMNEKLLKFGWGAVSVSGFIPPAAFMEFQSLGLLPIASDMRTIEHLLYTPAPDIVHEAAGHAPILVDEKFAEYLRSYADIAKKAIISKEDINLYEAIRELSDIKEAPQSTADEINSAEKKLEHVSQNMSYVSEASMLSRMNWWTAEYGLIGPLDNPKIFGAGLLSSLGEARSCLNPQVRKLPLDVNCVEYTYDITEKQPQLFVTPEFDTLTRVLEDLAEKMAFKRGGIYGLSRGREAETVTTTQLDSGLQISGVISDFTVKDSTSDSVVYLKFSGPCQLAFEDQQLKGHGKDYHSSGYGTPVGLVEGFDKPLWQANEHDLQALDIKREAKCNLAYRSGVRISGVVSDLTFADGRLLLISWSECTVHFGDEILFDPSWGNFDMATGNSVPSVFGGPADSHSYGEAGEFKVSIIPRKKYSNEDRLAHNMYSRIRNLREISGPLGEYNKLLDEYHSHFGSHWLIGVELLELAHRYALSDKIQNLQNHLQQLSKQNQTWNSCIQDGIRLASKTI